jgi:mycofactocin precursor
VRNVVDADRIEAAGNEEVDRDIAQVVPGRRASPADPVLGTRPHHHPALPLWHSMPYSCDLDHNCRDPVEEKVAIMEPNQQVENDNTELVTETLVEEVSIDGMCGVY